MSGINKMSGATGASHSLADWLTRIIASSLFLKATFVWFILQGLFFAFTVKVGLPPDENYHLSFIKLFSESGPTPFLNSQENYYFLGEAVRTPFFLYHFLFSIPYLIVNNIEHAYLPLRLLNLLISAFSLYMVMKIADEIKVSKLVRNLSLFMLVNTLMFTFLSAAVSYDNLFVFLSLASVLLLLKLLKDVTARYVLLFAVSVGAGSLVKINFLGVAAAVVGVLILSYHRNYKKAWMSFRKSFADQKKTNIALVIILLLLSVIILHRYGYNLVKYQTYAPTCDQVLSVDQCRENALYVRNEAVFGARQRAATKGVLEYAYDWPALIQERTYGIYAHEQLMPNKYVYIWVQLLIPLTLVAVARLWSRKRDAQITVLMGIVIFYVIVVMLENYKLYTASGRFSFVMHGRYLFSVLPLIYIISNHYILKFFANKYARGAFVFLSMIIFLSSSFPTYLVRANSEWYSSHSKHILRHVKNRVVR